MASHFIIFTTLYRFIVWFLRSDNFKAFRCFREISQYNKEMTASFEFNLQVRFSLPSLQLALHLALHLLQLALHLIQ